MGTLCLKCGDPGFAVALIYCDKCQEVAEHRYCLDVLPKTFTEYVTWFCEDCNRKDPLKDEVKVSSLSSKRSRQLSNSSKKNKLRSKSTPRSSWNSTTEEGVAISPVGNESTHSGQLRGVHSARNCTHSDGGMYIFDLDKSTEPNVRAYNNFDTEPSKQNMDHTMLMASTSEVLDPNAFVPSQPIYEPVWSGCFKLRVGTFGIVDGIAAHLSTKASLQVYEEARLLTESLCPELLPRLNFWPKGFIKSGPKDENIGLYFFPQNERYEKAYKILVDHMIEYDLAMRAAGANADLLIFTSMELPQNNWRFQAKYYLWGVFRGKYAFSSRVRNQALNCNTPDTDGKNEGVRKSHMTRSPHSPLSNGSSHGSA